MTLFSSTIAIAERWTDEASSTLRQAAFSLLQPFYVA